MSYIIWQSLALGVLILVMGLTGAILLVAINREEDREETGLQKKLYLVPLDEVSRGLADWLGSKLSSKFRFKINTSMVAKLPEESYSASRDSYFSSIILNKLQFLKASEDEYILAVTEEDLFTPNTDYVFSSSDGLAGVAIVSAQRLKPEFYGLPQSDEVVRMRAMKRAVHEIGHLLTLDNCDENSCLMYSSKTISDLDYQSDKFCHGCKLELTLPVKVPKT